MPRNLVVLGSTGSIGRQTLDVARQFRDRVKILGIAGHRNAALLSQQIAEFRPRIAAASPDIAGELQQSGAEIVIGESGAIELACHPDADLVVVGTSGRAGLRPTIAALRAGKLVALANKETLVSAGSIIADLLRDGFGTLVPIDSEHSAIWQCLQGEPHGAIQRITLTASGGALRSLPAHELEQVTPDQALRHPNWSMGPKVTVDSANLMNKGLEAIEAQWLFSLGLDQVEIVLHHQSIIHSLVTFVDGSTKAQLGLPDMRLPIQYALSHPERWTNELPRVDLADLGNLTFGPVDLTRYPALQIALDAGYAGGTYPAVLSAADEVAVEAFLDHRIAFTSIPSLVEETLQAATPCSSPKLDDILEADGWARRTTARLVPV